MDKKRLFRIMAKADSGAIAHMSDKIKGTHDIIVIKEPAKTLAMIKMRNL